MKMNRIIFFFISLIIFSNPVIGNTKKNLLLDSGISWIGAGVAYGPFRDNQFPGGPNPSVSELREDLHIISDNWKWIRVYGSRGITSDILQIIREDNLNIKVMLGAWIAKEDGLPIAKKNNKEEVDRAIELANKFPDVVNSINIGNETMVFWSDHIVDIKTMKQYIEYTSKKVNVPVSTADDFNFWNKDESKQIAEISDFIVLHIHPLWAGVMEEDALKWVQKIYNQIKSFHPTKTIVIGETGWATNRHNEGIQAELMNGNANEQTQLIYFNEFTDWAFQNKIPHHFFEVFDEKWKGGAHPDEVEKHWGVYFSNRKPKEVIKKSK